MFLLCKLFFDTKRKLMKEVTLQKIQRDGRLMKATFLPDNGMNLKSLMIEDIELIDQSTKGLFEEKMGGYGPLIGPHFYHRKDAAIAHVPDESIFPHIKRVRAKGCKEPFSHGIARYVPWNWSASETTIEGYLSGEDRFHEITLKALEGFDFKIAFKATLLDDGLDITMDVESVGSPSIAGLHYYYAIPKGDAKVSIDSQNTYNDMGTWRTIPKRWEAADGNGLLFDLNEESDFGFLSNRPNHTGHARLETSLYSLIIDYKTTSDENAFQLYYPKGASFVCIEPVTAKNPRDAKQMKNHLNVHIGVQ
jgi:hypothetical protein